MGSSAGIAAAKRARSAEQRIERQKQQKHRPALEPRDRGRYPAPRSGGTPGTRATLEGGHMDGAVDRLVGPAASADVSQGAALSRARSLRQKLPSVTAPARREPDHRGRGGKP